MKSHLIQAKDAIRAIPGLATAIFILSIVMMNILANKSIFNQPWIACTAGIFVSWVTFLCMDSICKRFGYKAATYLNIIGMLVNLCAAILFMLIVQIPGIWAASYSATSPEMAAAINNALDSTLASTWYVVVGSSIAMFCGGIVNSIMNHVVGLKLDNQGTYTEFTIRSVISTGLGQFVDNLVFALFVSFIFFGWSLTQVLVCSFTIMLVELLFEVVFSPIGYKITKKWREEGVGQDYIVKYNVND